jgi:hypothetical protein
MDLLILFGVFVVILMLVSGPAEKPKTVRLADDFFSLLEESICIPLEDKKDIFERQHLLTQHQANEIVRWLRAEQEILATYEPDERAEVRRRRVKARAEWRQLQRR